MRSAIIFVSIAALGAAVLVAGSSRPVGVESKDRRFRAQLTGYGEVPAISTEASGSFTATLNRDETMLTYELTYSGLESNFTFSHIHLGQEDVNGGVIAFLAGGPLPVPGLREGTATGVITAANIIGPAGQGIAPMEFDELVRALRAGVVYANIHTVQFPGGEIRGQLK